VVLDDASPRQTKEKRMADARLASSRAAELARRSYAIGLDADDVRQELLLQLWRRRSGFNPQRGGHAGFIARVIHNAAADLIAKHAAATRGGFQIPVSLDEPARDDDGEACRLADILPGEASLWASSAATLEMSELRADLRDAVAQLPGEHRVLCASLAHNSISETSRRQGCSRATIYKRIADIRRTFDRLGLADYLRRHPDTSRLAPVDNM
jgi:RNA polymerase sigma factor (sigma-70 family)